MGVLVHEFDSILEEIYLGDIIYIYQKVKKLEKVAYVLFT